MMNKEELQAFSDLLDDKLKPIQDTVTKTSLAIEHEIKPQIKFLYETRVDMNNKLKTQEDLESTIDNIEHELFAIKEYIKANK